MALIIHLGVITFYKIKILHFLYKIFIYFFYILYLNYGPYYSSWGNHILQNKDSSFFK